MTFWWAALACRNLEIDTAVDAAAWGLTPGGSASSYEVVTRAGDLPLTVRVRGVGLAGGTVPGQPASVTVDGGEPIEVELDGSGVGSFVIEAPGVHSVDAGGGPVEVVVWPRPWAGPGWRSAIVAPGPANTSVPATGGALVSDGAVVRWVDAAGSATVLAPDAPISAVEGVDLDGDGLRDGMVSFGDELALLRGVVGGGMTLTAIFSRPGVDVVDVAGGDVTGDGIADLAVSFAGSGVGPADTAAAGESTGSLWVLVHDGAFGFSPVVVDVPADPGQVTIGDNDGDRTPELTALTALGGWVRRTVQGGAAVPTLLGTPEVTDPASELHGEGDLNGDGAPEMFVASPLVPASDRELAVYDLYGGVSRLEVGAYEARYAWADATGDGRTDVFQLEGAGQLGVLSYDGEYTIGLITYLDEIGPIVAADAWNDEIVDLLVAGPAAWWWFPGTRDEEDRWRPQTTRETWTSLTPSSRVVVRDAAAAEVAALEDAGGEVHLIVWAWVSGASTRVFDGVLAGAVEGRDLASCGGVSWALTDAGLHRVRADGSSAFLAVKGGKAVACGAAPAGGTAAVLADGAVLVVDDTLAVVATEDVPGAVAVAVGPLAGAPTVETCDVAGCSVVAWHDGFVTGGDALAWRGADLVALAGSGAVSVGDVDLDGTDDLVAIETGIGAAAWVYRSIGDTFAGPSVHHVAASLAGPAAIVDGHQDGQRDFVLLGELGLYLSPAAVAEKQGP